MSKNHTFHVAAKALILRQDEVLLLNAFNEHTNNEYWDLPGGRMQAGEEIEETLHRELREELPGIRNIKEYGIIHAGTAIPFRETGEGVFIVVFRVSAWLPEPVTISHEHHGYVWVDEKKLDRLKQTKKQPYLGKHEYAAAKHVFQSL